MFVSTLVAIVDKISSSIIILSNCVFFLKMARRVSKSGLDMSAIKPQSNLDFNLSSNNSMSLGGLSLDNTICFPDS